MRCEGWTPGPPTCQAHIVSLSYVQSLAISFQQAPPTSASSVLQSFLLGFGSIPSLGGILLVCAQSSLLLGYG